LAILACGCGGAADGLSSAAPAARIATWTAARHVPGVVDLSHQRRDGSIVVAAGGRLSLLSAAGALRPFASAYSSRGGEPYIALSSRQRAPGAGCSFPADNLYVLRLGASPGVVVVDRRGGVLPFVNLPGGSGLLNGIAFDDTGRFGHRLLVTSVASSKTTLYAIDCRRRIATLTATGPRVEGGIVVAPATFGRFAGDLIAPDELTGKLYAFAPDGRSTLIGQSGLPFGPDTGIESAGFVPRGFAAALLADRLTRGNPHPGDDVILRLRRAALTAVGVQPGDLLVATEDGAKTIAVRCGASCGIRHVADGPAVAHPEGHIVFSR
jgi:hypothetical protein